MACSPGRVAVTLGEIQSALGWHRQAGVQGSVSVNYDSCRTHSAVFCIAFLQERRKEAKEKRNKRKNSFPVSWLAAAGPQHLGFQGC
jgi:hypothetical protein